MSNIIKKIVLWDYARASWQWDVLCILIICFIFLTPKSWYENKKTTGQDRAAAVIAAKANIR
jgi:hypothetical protein